MTLVGPFNDVCWLGAGTAFPERVLSNDDVLSLLGYADPARRAFAAAGITHELGLRSRAWSHVPGEPFAHASEATTLSLAVAAADRSLQDAAIQARDLQVVIVSTSTPPRWTNTVSAQVGAALGTRCACFDLRTGCAGTLFALSMAATLPKPALIIGTETFSKVIPRRHKMAMLSLGDGAGALVIGQGVGVLEKAYMNTDGALGKLISTDGALPPTNEEIARGGYVLSGAPAELADALPPKYKEALSAVGARADDLYIPHQTTRPLMEAHGFEEVFINVDRHANIGAAGWIAAFAERRPRDRRVALAAVGGGMSWAGAVWSC